MKTIIRTSFVLLSLLTCGSGLAQQLDVSDPDQALLARNKLFCDNEPGVAALYWWQGRVYSRIPGEKDKHIFNVQGFNTRQCARFNDDVLAFADAESYALSFLIQLTLYRIGLIGLARSTCVASSDHMEAALAKSSSFKASV